MQVNRWNIEKGQHPKFYVSFLFFNSNTSINLKLQHCPGPPPGIFFNFLPLQDKKKIDSHFFWKANFFWKSNISDHGLLHIDQTLKPKPCRPFLLSHLTVNYLPLNSSILKEIPCVFRRKDLTLPVPMASTLFPPTPPSPLAYPDYARQLLSHFWHLDFDQL